MGNLFSKSLPPATAQGIKNVLDTILQEMFKRADFIDLYSLADPERCSRYIVVAESALQKLFVKIKLQPELGTDGTFMVQKLEGLQKKNPLGTKQTEYCRILAFYFIRIFQIYAALALSVLDSDLPQENIQAIRPTDEAAREASLLLKPNTLPGFPAQKQSQGFGSIRSFFGFGGALEANPGSQYKSFYLTEDLAGFYSILNLFLNRPVEGAQSNKDMKFAKYPDMLIPQKGLYDFPAGPESRVVRPALLATLSNPDNCPTIIYTVPAASELNAGPQTIAAGLQLAKDGQRLIVKLLDAKLQSKPDMKSISIQGELFYVSPTDENPKSKTGQDLADLLASLFKAVVKQAAPTGVSAIPFLQRFKLLTKFEGDAPIVGTRITIPNPKKLFVDGVQNVPIVYKDSVQLEKGSDKRSITIETAFSVSKKEPIVGRPHEYTLTISLENMDIDPPALAARIRPTQKTISSTFNAGINNSDTPTDSRGKTVAAFMQGVFEKLVSGSYEDNLSRGGIEFKQGIPQPYNSPTLPPELKVKALWQALAKKPPMKAYCVARAAQLLNVAAISKNISEGAYTEACRLKFPYVQEAYVPTPGKPVTDVPGIRAAELLFFDTIRDATPKVANTAKYATFVRGLQKSFTGSDLSGATPALSKIEDETAQQFCKGRGGDKAIPLKPTIVSSLRKQALEMLDRQKNHIPRVMELLYKMFDARKLQNERQLAFNAKFAAGGMAAVNQLAEEARDLLMEYYSDCEGLYKGGLALMAAKMPPAAAASGPQA